jgi:hypothetical protein
MADEKSPEPKPRPDAQAASQPTPKPTTPPPADPKASAELRSHELSTTDVPEHLTPQPRGNKRA